MMAVARGVLSVVDPIDGLLMMYESGGDVLPWLTDAAGNWVSDLAATTVDASFINAQADLDFFTSPYTLVDHTFSPNTAWLYNLEDGTSTSVALDFASALGGVVYTAWHHTLYCDRGSNIIYHYGTAFDNVSGIAYVFTRTISPDGATVTVLDEQPLGLPFAGDFSKTFAFPYGDDRSLVALYYLSNIQPVWTYDFKATQTITLIAATPFYWTLVGASPKFHYYSVGAGGLGYGAGNRRWHTCAGNFTLPWPFCTPTDPEVDAVESRRTAQQSYSGVVFGALRVNTSRDGLHLIGIQQVNPTDREVSSTSNMQGTVPITTGVVAIIQDLPAASVHPNFTNLDTLGGFSI